MATWKNVSNELRRGQDWDRPGVMSDGDGLADVGKSVKAATDVTHAHIMPYYHPDAVPLCGGAWEYVSQQLEWLREQVDQPLFITQVACIRQMLSASSAKLSNDRPCGPRRRGGTAEGATKTRYR